MAALALVIAYLLRLADSYFKLLAIIPSPLVAWQRFCQKIADRLNRKERSHSVLRTRSRIVVIIIILLCCFAGMLIEHALNTLDNDYLDIALLSFFLLALPPSHKIVTQDNSARLRFQVESGVFSLLERNFGCVIAWVFLGWIGILLIHSFTSLYRHVSTDSGAFNKPIERFTHLLLLPASFLGLFIGYIAGFFTSKARPLVGLRAGLAIATQPYGALLLACSESLGLSLAGPKGNYMGLAGREWLGKGVARLQKADIRRWQWFEQINYGLFVCFLLLLSLML